MVQEMESTAEGLFVATRPAMVDFPAPEGAEMTTGIPPRNARLGGTSMAS